MISGGREGEREREREYYKCIYNFHTCTSIQSIVSVVRAGAAVNNSTISLNVI